MKRNKKRVLLISILSLLLSGCSVNVTSSHEVRLEYTPDDSCIILEARSSTGQTNPFNNNNMQLMLENEELSLYMGTQYDIAVVNKKSGSVTYSNPVYYEMDQEKQDALAAESKKVLFSQVGIEYYSESQKKSQMTSYPDCVSDDKNQVTYEVENDILTITYGIGTNYSDTGLIPVFTKDTFETYEQVLKQKVEEKEISIIDYRAYKNNYTKLSYSEMSKEEQAEYIAKYPNIDELDTIYVIKSGLTNKIMNQILELYTLAGITKEVQTSEKEKLGETAESGSQPYFVIPLSYRLHGGDLIVSVDLEKIECAAGFYLTKVDLLPSFGATKSTDDGYLFLPDGSGSIVNNDVHDVSMDSITIPFYGQDYGLDYNSSSDIAINSIFPVFGLKRAENAVFGIVESGSSIGGVCAKTTNSYLTYNVIYPYFNYMVVDSFGREGVAYAFYDVIPEVTYAVRYHFLTDENATYSGMATYYQKYLLESGVLNKKEEKNIPLDIALIGSIAKTKNYLGIPVEKEYAVTGFEDAEKIMGLLLESGIKGVDVLYKGMINGGMKYKAAGDITVQSELGGKKGFINMSEKLSEYEDTVYPEVDFSRIYEKGNGITKKEQVSKYLSKNTVYLSQPDPATGNKSYENASFLVNPLCYESLANDFLSSYPSLKNPYIYVSGFGSNLNGNYSLKAGVTRQTSMIKTCELLQRLKDNGYQLKLDSGNSYVLSYADSLCNVPTESTHQRIESYSIPFVGMVLKGIVPFTSAAINQQGNYEKAVLSAIESGAGLSYELMYENQLILSGTEYTNLFSVNYELWMESIIDNYQKMQKDLGGIFDKQIISHIHLTDDVNEVIYEDGTRVYVNYSDDAYQSEDGIVDAMSYLVAGQEGRD